MSDEKIWNDEARDKLREWLRSQILGELRLTRHVRPSALEYCREYIEDECPADEVDTFVQFTGDELDRIAVQLESEKTSWPDETDCDRLDRVELVLRERGILLWQVSPCCNTCTISELGDRVDTIDRRSPGFRDRVRGYAYFIDQGMPEDLARSSHISVYIGYGWFPPDGAETAPQVYQENVLGIGREICECLANERFEADWNGDPDQKIVLSLNWQRRKPLE